MLSAAQLDKLGCIIANKMVERLSDDLSAHHQAEILRNPGWLDELLDEKVAAKIVNCKISTLQSWRVSGAGPPFVKISRLVRYRRREIFEWIQEHLVKNTGAPVGRKLRLSDSKTGAKDDGNVNGGGEIIEEQNDDGEPAGGEGIDGGRKHDKPPPGGGEAGR